MKLDTENLTEGNIAKSLIRFAIPFLLASFLQSIYGAADMMVLGWFSDSASIAAVATGSHMMFIISSLVNGLGMGGTVLIGQYCGSGRKDDAGQTAGTMLTMLGILGVVMTVLMYTLAPFLLRALQTPAEAFRPALDYVRVCSCGILFIFGYNGISAILRGFGDSKRPLIFVGIACVLNIVLDIAFVGGFGWGAGGAAFATILSQGVSMASAMFYLNHKKFIFSFRPGNFRIHRSKAARLLRLGIPVALQGVTVDLSFLFITAIVNRLGVTVAAAVAIAGKLESFALLPSMAFSSALSAFVAQNIGAGKPERATKAMRVCIACAFGCALVFFLWAQFAPGSAMHLFRADAEATAVGARYLQAFSFDFILVAFGFSQNGFLNGCGKTTVTSINNILASIVLRLPLAYLFSVLLPTDLIGIGAAAPIATVISTIVAGLYIRSGRWRNHTVVTGGPASPLAAETET